MFKNFQPGFKPDFMVVPPDTVTYILQSHIIFHFSTYPLACFDLRLQKYVP